LESRWIGVLIEVEIEVQKELQLVILK